MLLELSSCGALNVNDRSFNFMLCYIGQNLDFFTHLFTYSRMMSIENVY
uniref:Uncharacterized protein n=1 Tax=Arundo donax TaxID=35708 RepID=A0A0A8YUX4_ARUDO